MMGTAMSSNPAKKTGPTVNLSSLIHGDIPKDSRHVSRDQQEENGDKTVIVIRNRQRLLVQNPADASGEYRPDRP